MDSFGAMSVFPLDNVSFGMCVLLFHSLSYMGYAIEAEITWTGAVDRCEEAHR